MTGHRVPKVCRGLFLFTLVLFACSSDEEDKRKACERYRDHLVELRLADAPNAKVAAQHRDLIKQALGDDFISSCESGLTADQIRCGLVAVDSSAVLSCGAASE